MSSGAILEGKKKVVDEITEKMKAAQSFVFVSYEGLNVEQATKLREKMREANVDYKIYKNTSINFAVKECKYDALSECLKGTTAVAFCNDDAVKPAKVIADFISENKVEVISFKGGVIDGAVSDAKTIEAVSKLPSKEVLLARLLGSMNAPIANFAVVLNEIKKQNEAQGA